MPDWMNANKIYFVDPQELEIKHNQRGNTVHLAYNVDCGDQAAMDGLRTAHEIITYNMSRLAEIIVRIPVYNEHHFLKYRFVECHVVEERHDLDGPRFQRLGVQLDMTHLNYEIGFTCIYHEYQHSPVTMEQAMPTNIPGLPNEFRQYRLHGARNRLG